ncbi:YbjQ family protein [Edaphobacter flagellatus]|uniref:YbjQ family protein n=1 Tax=Edaphobacter flagellatus TaxID=1933044 RepID=UPI0021B1EBC0|nr:YbjQ family protein [Edaphobacter flagellatus]
MSTYPPPQLTIDPALITSALELPGYRVVRNHGIVRGIVVRSRNIFGTLGAGLQTMLGGDITIFTQLCEKTRQDSFAMMALHAGQLGANAVIAFRYDANELMNGVTEVLAYGTAVTVERIV